VLAFLVIMARLPVIGALLLLACDGAANRSIDPVAPAPLPPPPPPAEWKAEFRLDGLLPPDAVPVGVAVDPAGRRYVLDRRSGLYQLDGSGARLVISLTDVAATLGLGLDLELTDVAALGDGRFALTAENDGFLLDLSDRSVRSYFCYFPINTEPMPPPEVGSVSQTLQREGVPTKQRTESVAFSAETGFLFAQPRTIRLDTGAIAGSELFMFLSSGGQPFQVRSLPDPAFMAGGMVSVDQRVLLGSHNRIYAMTAWSPVTLLRAFQAPLEITGMAREPDGDLLLLDGAGRRLLKVSEQ
jgi:hypothetical protein